MLDFDKINICINGRSSRSDDSEITTKPRNLELFGLNVAADKEMTAYFVL